MATGFNIKIGAIDGFTGTLDKINSRLAAFAASQQRMTAKLTAPFTAMGKSLGEFSKLSGLSAIGRSFANISQHALTAAASLGRMMTPLLGIAGAVSVAGMLRLTSSFAGFNAQIGNTANRLGISTREVMRWRGAAEQAGVSADSMVSGLNNLGTSIRGAINGTDTDAARLFSSMGVSLRDASGHARSVSDILPEVTERISRMRDPFYQAQAAAIAFGGASEDLLPLLRQGREALLRNAAAAERNYTVTEEAAAQGRHFGQAMADLRQNINGVWGSITDRLIPVLIPLIERFSRWLQTNRELISVKVMEFIDAIIAGIRALSSVLLPVIENIGGMKTALIVLGAWMAANFVLMILAPIRLLSGLILGLPAAITATTSLLGTLGAVFLSPGFLALAAIAGAFSAISMLSDIGRRSPEMQTEQRGNFRERGRAGGFYGAPATDPDAPATAAPGPAASSNDRQQFAMDHYVRQGYTPAQAAGMVGYHVGESGVNLNTNAFNPAGGGQGAMGIGQWRADRIDRFRATHGGRDQRSATLEEQLDWTNTELNTTERSAAAALRNTNDPRTAADVFTRQFGRPRADDTSIPRRQAAAQGAYDLYMSRQNQPRTPAAPTIQTPAPIPMSSLGVNGAIQVSVNDNTSNRFNVAAASRGNIFGGQPEITSGFAYGSI